MTRKYYMCWEHPSHRVNTLTYNTILSFPSILENYLCIPPNSPLVSMLAIALLYSANDLHNKYTILNLHNRVLIPLAYPSMELILLAHIHQCQVFYQKLKCTMKVTSHSMGIKNTDGSFHHFSMLLLHKSYTF